MIEIESKENGNGYNIYTIVTHEGSFNISFEGNPDLYLIYNSKDTEEASYKIIFTKGKNVSQFKTIAIDICNSGSRYFPLNVQFTMMYKKLEEYDYSFHQYI